MATSVQQGNIYWYQEAKKRPVLVLSRDSALPFLAQIMVAPITRKVLEVPSFVRVHLEDLGEIAINLDAVQLVEKNKVSGFIARLSKGQMLEVRGAISFALGFDDLEADS
ncbi:MAG: type II toxin-antitoxin system PemK/MazF family toxin [Trueperaceae bacterium]